MKLPFAMLTLAALSLKSPAVIPELYEEMWWYSGSMSASTTATSSATEFLSKGTNGTTVKTGTDVQLFTFSANWPVSTQCAFECAISTNSGAATGYAALYDFTSSTIVSQSQVSFTGASTSVVRSGKFTLIPGHKYGVSFWVNNASYQSSITDASLVVFPPAGSVSPSLSRIGLAGSGSLLKEAYIPLALYSINSLYKSGGGGSASTSFVVKGSTTTASATSSATALHTLNSSWNPSQKFALEASICSQSGGTVYLQLWDQTTSSVVAASQISTASTTATLIRSASFTLVPGHSYALSLWNSGAYTPYVDKAYIVALDS